MKKLIGFACLAVFLFFCFSSCAEKVDLEKEKEAIMNAFEMEKAAYFKQDYAAMGEWYVNDPSTVKMFIGAQGISRTTGWEEINALNKKETADTTWDREKVTAAFLNYQINIEEETAWVLCNTRWDGILRGDTVSLDQFRINVLKKVNNKWKFALVAIYGLPEAQK